MDYTLVAEAGFKAVYLIGKKNEESDYNSCNSQPISLISERLIQGPPCANEK